MSMRPAAIMPMRSLLLSAVAAAAVAGCGTLEDIEASGQTNLGVCPNIFALGDAARMVTFNGDSVLENVSWTAEITDVRTSCRYVGDRPIEARVEVDFAVGRGPMAQGDVYNLPYFVAVTRTNRAVIAREEYTVPVKVKRGRATAAFTQKINEIVIPRKDSNVSGSNFEIAVGLGLTREQLLYNRSGKSLKFPNLSKS